MSEAVTGSLMTVPSPPVHIANRPTRASGALCRPFHGFHEIQHARPGIMPNLKETDAHARRERIMIGLGAYPGDDTARLQPFRLPVRKRELQPDLRSHGQWAGALDEEASPADSAGSAFRRLPSGRRIPDL